MQKSITNYQNCQYNDFLVKYKCILLSKTIKLAFVWIFFYSFDVEQQSQSHSFQKCKIYLVFPIWSFVCKQDFQ
jgi:hypothetical protein